MMHKKLFLALAILTTVSNLQPAPVHAQSADITAQLENLGNPTKTTWPDSNTACRYARNVWDLQNYNNKLYIGSGNSSNNAPCSNTGPINVISYNPQTNTFTSDYTANEEQIDQYKILNNQLVIPGHDPKDDFSFGNWYRLENNSWVKYRNLKDTVHIFDMAYFNNSLVSAGGTQTLTSSQVQFSTDNGVTWNSTNLLDPFRSWTLVILQNKLYVFRGWAPMFPTVTSVFEFNGTANLIAYPALNNMTMMFPQTNWTSSDTLKVIRPINFNNALVYIGALAINDQQSDPVGLYKTTSITTTGSNTTKINLPNNAKPWDTLIGQNGKLYILGSIPNGSRNWVTVSSTSDLNTWTEEFRFDAATFARSFEQIGGDWYFGLGTDTTALSTSTGDILKYKAILPSPSPSPMASIKPGDTNADNNIDIFDHNTLLTNFGKPGGVTQGDSNNSGTIEIFDYNNLLTNFGK